MLVYYKHTYKLQLHIDGMMQAASSKEKLDLTDLSRVSSTPDDSFSNITRY